MTDTRTITREQLAEAMERDGFTADDVDHVWAALPETPALDVERLGQVLALVFDHQPPWWDVRAGPDDAAAARRTFTWAADRIASEYARLAGIPEPSDE